jgi:acid phosphatase type 7
VKGRFVTACIAAAIFTGSLAPRSAQQTNSGGATSSARQVSTAPVQAAQVESNAAAALNPPSPQDSAAPSAPRKPTAAPGTANAGDAVFVGAGDIADCGDLSGAEATAKLLDKIPGTVFTLGDNVYPDGTAQQFSDCYGPTWGRHKSRTRPSTGNHDFHSGGASPYFDYFGAAAGDPRTGAYSYDLGAWHIISLNSECLPAGGCGVGSPQEKWLKQDLQAHPATCTLAYWHKPLFSSGGSHGNDSATKAFWDDLYAAHAALILTGHDHDYERFAPQDPDGKSDPAHGIREFVVGTGGKSHRPFIVPLPNSEARNADTFGVLKLTLHPNSYDWEFIPEAGESFTDSGRGACPK